MNEESNLTIGRRIEEIRINKMKMNKEEFAEVINMPGQQLGRIERGLSGLTIERLICICRKTKTSPEYILFGKKRARKRAKLVMSK